MATKAESNHTADQLNFLETLQQQGLWTTKVEAGALCLQAAVDSGKAILRGLAIIELSEDEKDDPTLTRRRIRPSATIGAAVIAQGATVGVRATLENGVSLRHNATVERGAILKEGACVGNFSTVREGAVLGEGVFVGSCGVTVKAGVKVPAGERVFDSPPSPSQYAV